MLPLLDAHREGSANEIVVQLALKLHQVLSPGLGSFSERRVWLLVFLPTTRSVFFRKRANFVVSGWHVLNPSVSGMSREQTRLSFLLKWTVACWREWNERAVVDQCHHRQSHVPACTGLDSCHKCSSVSEGPSLSVHALVFKDEKMFAGKRSW